MRFDSLKISNWRSIKEIDIEAQDLMVIIGRNNHGKSNILSAILFFFSQLKHQDLDFNCASEVLFVEIVFNDLSSEEKSRFTKYLTSDNKITVRKTAYKGGSFEYRGFVEKCTIEWLREEEASSYTKRENVEDTPLIDFLPAQGRITKQDVVNAQTSYIEEHRGELEFVYQKEETEFLGLKSVAASSFGELYFIPAVKDAVSDFSSKESSVFGRIYSGVISSMSESNNDWRAAKERLAELFSIFNINDDGEHHERRPQEITELELSLSRELRVWGTKIDIEIKEPDIDSVIKSNTQIWIDDGVRTDIVRKGHGLQRALTLALVQVLAKETPGRIHTDEDVRISNSKYFIFEEPELYLHPQAQRQLFDSFVRLSDLGSQVIICTHSSGLIDLERYRSIYIADKSNDEAGTVVRKCAGDIFEGNEKRDFNLTYWINPDRSELFFAKKVILLEGATEKAVIPALAKRFNIFNYEYTAIDCGSKNSIPQYIKLLNCFLIPYVAVYDLDHQLDKSRDAVNAADISTQKILDAIENEVGYGLALVNDIEEELGLSRGAGSKPYEALNHINSREFQISVRMLEKITNIYS